MPSEEHVRYTRVFEDFETFYNKEVVYCGINAAILWFEKNDPENPIISTLGTALGHRLEELKDFHNETVKKTLN